MDVCDILSKRKPEYMSESFFIKTVQSPVQV